jgi:hypothetical protein
MEDLFPKGGISSLSTLFKLEYSNVDFAAIEERISLEYGI